MVSTSSGVRILEVDRVVGVAIQFQQSLVNPLEEPDNVTLVVGLFEDTHPDATELGPALHQRLVTQQHGLTEQTRLVHQHRVDGTGPLHGFLKQRDGNVNAHLLEGLCNLHRAVVQTLKIPGHVGDVVLFAVGFRPIRCHDNIPTVKFVGRFYRIQAGLYFCSLTGSLLS